MMMVPSLLLSLLHRSVVISSLCSSLSLSSSCRRASSSRSMVQVFGVGLSSSKDDSSAQAEANRRIIHLNHAGASPCSDAVLQRVWKHLQLEQQWGGYAAAATVQDELDRVYQSVADLVHASSQQEIALTESATVAWTRIFYAALQQRLNQDNSSSSNNNINTEQQCKRYILISGAEYAANAVAACQWARQHEGWNVLYIPSAAAAAAAEDDSNIITGMVDLNALRDMLEGRFYYRENANTTRSNKQQPQRLDPSNIAMICITHIPTNSGIVNPVQEIGRLLQEYHNQQHLSKGNSKNRIFYLVDTCQSVGQLDVNVQDMQCDALVATGRKYLRGPRGTGFLYVSNNILDNGITPHHCDHFSMPVQCVPEQLDTIVNDNDQQRDASLQQPLQNTLSFAPRPGAKRFEFWESNIANKLGLGTAVQELLHIGLDKVAETTQQRALYLYDQLSQIQYIRMHHRPASGIVTFWIDDSDDCSADWKERLWNDDNHKFEVAVVPATSTPIDSSTTRVPNLLRASVLHTTTVDDIDLFCARLQELILQHKEKSKEGM